MTQTTKFSTQDLIELRKKIGQWAQSLGFQAVGISDIQLNEAEKHLHQWLDKGYHGTMNYMQHHGSKRSQPNELIPGTTSIISLRMDYFPPHSKEANDVLADPQAAYISRYALGRDYHKVLRKRIQQLANLIEQHIGPFGHRVFVDSAPVLEKPIAEKAGLGWIGKHSNLLSRESGSWYFLGELYIDLPLPPDQPLENHCGTCTACIDACPTKAIVEPYVVDARLCISYLTIEHHGPIPVELRKPMGNRIYGCDDCQLYCPWNRFSKESNEADFTVRHQLDDITLVELFEWDEQTFLKKTEGSPVRRIGYERWLRNIAVALGNAKSHQDILYVLKKKQHSTTPLVKEHIQWALDQHRK